MEQISHPFMSRQMPDLSGQRERKYESEFRKHPIVPRAESCVKVNDMLFCQSYYWNHHLKPEGATEEIYLRKTVAKKLVKIDRELRRLGLQLLIQDGYRSLALQKFVRETSVPLGLKGEYPSLTDEEHKNRAKMFAAPIGENVLTSPPPHLTGGVVDLTIVCSGTHKQVHMGKRAGLYNTAFPDALEKLESNKLEDARRFRRLLFWLAFEEDMLTNPSEWWHLSWGDQMWACVMKGKLQPAVYGIAESFL